MKIDIKMQLPSDAEMKRMFDAVPVLEQYQVADKVVRAGARPITTRARQLIPRSKESDRAKWDEDRRGGKGRWAGLDKKPLKETVKLVVRKGRQGSAVAVTGPEFTGEDGPGSKIYFTYIHKKKWRKENLWTKGWARTFLKRRNVMIQAAEETRPQQLAAMKAKLKTLMDQVWKHG